MLAETFDVGDGGISTQPHLFTSGIDALCGLGKGIGGGVVCFVGLFDKLLGGGQQWGLPNKIVEVLLGAVGGLIPAREYLAA